MPLCELCKTNPDNHSFRLYSETEQHTWFYCSDNYIDRNTDNVMNHIKGELENFHERHPGKKWSILFDSRDFTFRWDTTFDLSMKLIELLKTYTDTFMSMKIIRSNSFMYYALELCKPFLQSSMLSKIKFET